MWQQIFTITLCLFKLTKSYEIETIKQWSLVDFVFPYDQQLIQSYRPENTVLTGFEVTDDRIFVAIPRLRSGVPATLASIPRHSDHYNPPLQAYPNWDAHSISRDDTANCTGLISVYRLRKDSCNRLWVLDSGIRNSLEDFTRVCPPKLVVFDLLTDQIVRTVILPKRALRPASLLTNLILDESVQGTCDHSFVYISDTAAPGIIVYDGRKDTAWRLMHPTMFPDPDFSDYNINGETFTLMDGIIGLAHSPKLGTLFFQPLATDRIFSISTSVLTKGPPAEFETLPINLVGKKSSQGVGMAINPSNDDLYFSPLTETSIAAWNPITNNQKLIAYDPAMLQFPAELRYIEEDGAIWTLTTRFQRFFNRNVNSREINLRILRVKLAPSFNRGLNGNFFY